MTPLFRPRFPVHRVVQGLLVAAIMAIGLALCLSVKPWTIVFPEGKRVPVENYVAVYSWWAGLLNLLPLTLLAITAKFWLRPLKIRDPQSAIRHRKWFWPVIGAAMLACAGMNAPRLAHGLWDDEEYTLRRIVLGSYRINSEGEPKLKEVPWSHTIWYYGKPNNHFLNSIAGRLSNTLWRVVRQPEGLQFSEAALRLPAFAAGVLSLAAWGLLLRTLGFPAAGALAAWLIALHPWHMRFVPELRGYAFVFLFLPLACLLALRAVRSGGWKWWAAYGAAQFGLFYSWPGTTFALAVLNAGVLTLIACSPGDRATLAIRWLVATGAAGLTAFQLYLPCVAQLFGHLDDWDAKGLGWPWVCNVGSRLLTGMPWHLPGGTLPEMSVLFAQHPVFFGGLMAAVLGLIVLGLARCVSSGMAGSGVALVLILPGPATFLFARLKDTYLFEWYVVFMVPGLMALGALGLSTILAPLAARRLPLAVTCAVVLLSSYALATQAARHRLITQPVQFTRDSVLQIRPTLNPHDPRNREILTVATLATPEIYDPNIRRVKSGAELVELIRQADRSGYPLFINQGYANILADETPSLAALISRPDIFEKIAILPGIEPMFDREILRYRPGSLSAFSPSP